MTQRNGTGREVGGGFRMGNTHAPLASGGWAGRCSVGCITLSKNLA